MRHLIFLLLCYAACAESALLQPCSFPEQCRCSLFRKDVSYLSCSAMENCLHQVGMDDIADSIKPECPILMFSISCSKSAQQAIEVRPSLFKNIRWQKLRRLTFGHCNFVFKQNHLLKYLPMLTNLEMQFSKVTADLGRLSEIMCCSTNLSTLYFKGVSTGSKSKKFGSNSFIGFQSLSKLVINYSPKLLHTIAYRFNTSSPSLKFEIYGNLPPGNPNFSSLVLTNAFQRSALQLGLHDNWQQFELDSPGTTSGFTLTHLTLNGYPKLNIWKSPFSAFKLKTVQISRSEFDEAKLSKLLNALTLVKDPLLFNSLVIEFSLKRPGFPIQDFNKLCERLPRLRSVSITKSTISFSETQSDVFLCPQLRHLSITACNLKRLPSNALSGLPSLTALILSSSGLFEFPKEALRNTPKLVKLRLDKNNKMDIRADSLRGIVPNLQHLDLSNANVAETLSDAFIDQKNLAELFLNNLSVRRRCLTKKTWFRGCDKLIRLDLSNSPVFSRSLCHTYGFLAPLRSLKILDLAKCNVGRQIDGVLKTLFSNLNSLTDLGLSQNQIAKVEYLFSVRIPNLTRLYLNDNPFSEFSTDLLFKKMPNLKELRLASTPIVKVDPAAFNRIPGLRIQLGGNQFDCSCDLMPFTDWIRQQYPQYLIESRGDWLSNAMCYKMLNGSELSSNKVRLLDFNLSWWDCYSRRLIVGLSSSIGGLLIAFAMISLVSKYRWKLRYTLLAFCIRHGLVKRKSPSQWIYDACFIYDETDSSVSEWVEALVLKLETDLQLRLYEAERDAPAGSNILDEAASAIDKSRHAVLVLSQGFLENKLNLYSAQWSSESVLMRRQSLAVLVMRDRLSESELRHPGCKVLHRLYRMCKRNRIVDCSGCGVGGNSANRLGLLLYDGRAGRVEKRVAEDSETEPLLLTD